MKRDRCEYWREYRGSKRAKRQEKIDVLRVRDRKGKKSDLNVVPISDELSNTVVENSSNVEEVDGASIENSTQPSLPAFQIGEIVSVEGDTRERG